MRNNRLLPYETIVQAASGEPEAVGTVLQYYRRRIQCEWTGRPRYRGLHHPDASHSYFQVPLWEIALPPTTE